MSLWFYHKLKSWQYENIYRVNIFQLSSGSIFLQISCPVHRKGPFGIWENIQRLFWKAIVPLNSYIFFINRCKFEGEIPYTISHLGIFCLVRMTYTFHLNGMDAENLNSKLICTLALNHSFRELCMHFYDKHTHVCKVCDLTGSYL